MPKRRSLADALRCAVNAVAAWERFGRGPEPARVAGCRRLIAMYETKE
jgi:hypothetical protein